MKKRRERKGNDVLSGHQNDQVDSRSRYQKLLTVCLPDTIPLREEAMVAHDGARVDDEGPAAASRNRLRQLLLVIPPDREVVPHVAAPNRHEVQVVPHVLHVEQLFAAGAIVPRREVLEVGRLAVEKGGRCSKPVGFVIVDASVVVVSGRHSEIYRSAPVVARHLVQCDVVQEAVRGLRRYAPRRPPDTVGDVGDPMLAPIPNRGLEQVDAGCWRV